MEESTPASLAEELSHHMRIAVLPVTVFVGVEAVLGFFGNLLVLYVFLFKYHVCNFKYFVLCLAFIDITSSVTTIPGEMVTQQFWYTYHFPIVCKIKSVMNMFTVSAEAMCLLLIAIDRYRKVCHPIAWQMKPRLAKLLCMFIFVLAAIVSTPVGFFWGTNSNKKLYMGKNITLTNCAIDGDFENNDMPLHYSISIEALIGTSLAVMFLLYCLIFRAIITGNMTLKRPERISTCERFSVTMTTDISDISDIVIPVSSDDPNNDEHISTELKKNANGFSNDESRGAPRPVSSTHAQPSISLERDMPTSTKSPDNVSSTTRNKSLYKRDVRSRVRRKTLIMFILTIAFIITTVLYLTLLSFIANGILRTMSDGNKAIYFFFFRLYFINHVINPIVYGLLDPQFRIVMQKARRRFSFSLSHVSSDS